MAGMAGKPWVGMSAATAAVPCVGRAVAGGGGRAAALRLCLLALPKAVVTAALRDTTPGEGDVLRLHLQRVWAA